MVNLSTTKLNVFRQVVESEGFSAAARKLFVSQPVVSAHVKALERELGTRLLRHDQRKMIPTEAGWSLYKYACATLDATQRLADEVAAYQNARSGRLHLGADTTAGTYSMGDLILSFLREHPDVDVSLNIADHLTIQQATLNGIVDFGYVTFMDLNEDLNFEPLDTDDLILVTLPEHRWAVLGGVTVSDLTQERFVGAAAGTARRTWEDRWLDEMGIRRRVQLASGHAEVCKQAIRAGFGVALMFRSSVTRELAEGTFAEVPLIDFPWPSAQRGLLRRKGAHLTPLERDFLEHCRRLARSRQD